jgi:P-type E1-E2 ATPase
VTGGGGGVVRLGARQHSVIAINVAIGIVQEGNAEKAAEALKAMLSPRATALRRGARVVVDAADLVPGDVVFVQIGDRALEDVRFLSAHNLSVQEAMLTGESLPVLKKMAPVAPNAALGDRRCMGFSATLVMSGQGTGVVVETGDDAEIGKISRLVAGVSAGGGKTRLMVQLEIFGRFISLVVVTGLTALLVSKVSPRSVAPPAKARTAWAGNAEGGG